MQKKIKNKKIDRTKMGFIVLKGKEKIECDTEQEVWNLIEKDWQPYQVTYKDGYWAKQFLPF